jgi:biopolymer transport protein ExbD
VDGEAMDWEQVKDRLGQLSSHPSSRVVILADERCLMEPVLKLLRAAKECNIEASISTSHVEADVTD